MRPTVRDVDGFVVPYPGETVCVTLYAYESDLVDEGNAISIKGTLFLIKETLWVAKPIICQNHGFKPHYIIKITPLCYFTTEPETGLALESMVLEPGMEVETGSKAIFY